jgi:TonB family protein
VHAQSAKDAEKAFRTTLLGQRLILRNFSALSTVDAHWDGSTVVLDEPFVRTLGAIAVDEVKFHSQQIEIKGRRNPLVNDPDKGWAYLPAASDVDVVVKLNGGDETALLQVLQDALFFKTLGEALAAKPRRVAPPTAAAPSPTPPNQSAVACDCVDRASETCKNRPRPFLGEGPPRLVYSINPVFHEDALAQKFKGAIQVAMVIDTQGNPQNLWITGPAGDGLDESAAEAVRQYRFKPATCHGNPIAVDLYLDVNVDHN